MRDQMLEDVLVKIDRARCASRSLLSVLDLDSAAWWPRAAEVRQEVDVLRSTAERVRPWLGGPVAARLRILADVLEAAERELILGRLLGPRDDGAGAIAVRRAERGLGSNAARMEHELRLLAGGHEAPRIPS